MEIIRENFKGETHLNLRRDNGEGKLEELFVARFRYVGHRSKARKFARFLNNSTIDLNTITQEELDQVRIDWHEANRK